MHEFLGCAPSCRCNPFSGTWRLSGELGISQFSVVHQFYDLGKSCWTVLHATKILSNFSFPLVFEKICCHNKTFKILEYILFCFCFFFLSIFIKFSNDFLSVIKLKIVNLLNNMAVLLYCLFFRMMHQDLKVIVGKQLKCMLGDKQRTVVVRMSPNQGKDPEFRKENMGLALLWPTTMNHNNPVIKSWWFDVLWSTC